MQAPILYGIVILAAGNSSRLGQPKQLLAYRNSSLLQNTIAASQKVEAAVVCVVTGAWQNEVEQETIKQNVHVFHNPEWETGMASSIKKGVGELGKIYPELDAIIITVCDQPFLTEAHLNSLIQEYNHSKKGLIASTYNNALGTPVLFSRSYVPALMKLEGKEGAKQIFHAYPDDLSSVPFPKGEIDIDTLEDYEKLLL